MENALLVQVILAEVSTNKFSACATMASIGFKGRIIHILVTVSTCIICDFFLQSYTLHFYMSVFLME